MQTQAAGTTFKGICSACQQTDIVDAEIYEGGNEKWFKTSLVAGCIFLVSVIPFWRWLDLLGSILFGLFPFIGFLILAGISRPKRIPARQCRSCGHLWRL